jgi:hypothetical protein
MIPKGLDQGIELVMKAPRHIRIAKKEALDKAKQAYLDAKANGTLERTGHTAKGLELSGRPVNLGFRSSPNLLIGYTFHQPMNAKGSYDKRKARSNLTDQELYLGGLDRDHKERGEARIRVGTTPSRMVPIKDKLTGEEKLVRVKAKAKWQDVGLVSCKPKDGGKAG